MLPKFNDAANLRAFSFCSLSSLGSSWKMAYSSGHCVGLSFKKGPVTPECFILCIHKLCKTTLLSSQCLGEIFMGRDLLVFIYSWLYPPLLPYLPREARTWCLDRNNLNHRDWVAFKFTSLLPRYKLHAPPFSSHRKVSMALQLESESRLPGYFRKPSSSGSSDEHN